MMKRKANILVVEDSKVLQQVTSHMLTSNGYRVSISPTGEDAVALVESAIIKFDLILMDIGLPGISGVEATKIIRCRHSADSLPILGYSTEEGHLQAALSAGMDGFYLKPLPQEMLISVVNTYLACSHTQDSSLTQTFRFFVGRENSCCSKKIITKSKPALIA